MSRIKSIFGPYAENLQLIIDNALDQFAPTWYQRYFGWATPQTSLTFTSAIGRARIEAAASIVDRNSQMPLRSRAALEKLTGSIPAIKEAFKMTEEDYRDFLVLQALNVDDNTKKQALLDFIFNDVKTVGNAAHKRLDIMCLEAISKAEISLTINNNPDGLVLADPVDLLMSAENKKNAVVSWDNYDTSKPFDDIRNIVTGAKLRGITFSKMLMTWAMWMNLIQSKQVTTFLSNFLGLKQAGNVLPTQDNVNSFLTAQGWPTIELVDATIGIEKDGKITAVQPWEPNNVSFVPAGNLGTIKNAIAIEQMRPVAGVSYATFNRALISKWSENNPFGEWTGVELNAFPSVEAIDQIYILTAVY
jgi:hypothetical protein